jgi:hypothetical protein
MRRQGRKQGKQLALRTAQLSAAYAPDVTGRAFVNRLQALQLLLPAPPSRNANA